MEKPQGVLDPQRPGDRLLGGCRVPPHPGKYLRVRWRGVHPQLGCCGDVHLVEVSQVFTTFDPPRVLSHAFPSAWNTTLTETFENSMLSAWAFVISFLAFREMRASQRAGRVSDDTHELRPEVRHHRYSTSVSREDMRK